MEWTDHDHWAAEFDDIPSSISREVNEIIDAVRQGKNVSAEYEQHLEACADSVITDRPKTGNSALDLVATNYAKREHDVSRREKTGDKLAAKLHKCAMKRMGEKYLKAYYLHHYLDYLDENSDLDQNFDQLLECYREDNPETYSQVVETFIRSRKDELIDDLGF